MNCKIKVSDILNVLGDNSLDTKNRNQLITAILQPNTQLSDHFQTKDNGYSIDKVVQGVGTHGSTRIQEAYEAIKNGVHNVVAKIQVIEGWDKSFKVAPVGTRPVEEEKYQGWEQPITLMTEKGKLLDAKIADAITAATMDWLVGTADAMRADNRSDADIRMMLGMDKRAKVTTKIRKSIKHIDGYRQSAAAEIGSKAYNYLGLKAKKDTDVVNNKRMEEVLKKELGVLGLMALEDIKAIKFVNDTSSTNEVDGQGKEETKGKKAYKLRVKEFALTDKIGLRTAVESGNPPARMRGVYRSAEEAIPKDNKIVNDGITGVLGDVVSAKHKEAVKKQSGTANYIREEYVQAVELLGHELKEDLGYEDESKVLDARASAVKGKNLMIDTVIEQLKATAEAFGKEPMFGRWKVITNNRFILDSNQFNWQDKKLHRYAVHRGKVKVTKGEMTDLFHLMIAQAFDLDIDKKKASTALKEVEEVIGDLGIEIEHEGTLEEFRDTEEYKKLVRDTWAELREKGLVGEPEHALSGMLELIGYIHEISNKRMYETAGMIETDAITSGYAIKGLAFPLHSTNVEDIWKELQRVGVFRVNDEYESYGDYIERPETNDSYEVPAKLMGEKLSVKMQDKELNTEIVKLVDPKAKINGNSVKISRSFMKSPFMVLNYGSAISSIRRSVTENAIENFYKLVEKGDHEATEKILDAVDKTIEEHNKEAKFKIVNVNPREIQGGIESMGLGFVLTPKDEKAIMAAVDMMVGESLEETFTEKYGEFIALTKTLNTSFVNQFRIAKVLIDRKVDEWYAKKEEKLGKNLIPPMSEKEFTKIVREVGDVLPVFRTALTTKDGNYAVGLIADKQRVPGKDLRGNVVTSAKIRFTDRAENVALEVYDMVEKYTSGSVVPIHFMDAVFQAKVLSKFEALGVHDANYGKLDEIQEITKAYNKAFYDTLKEFSMAKEFMRGLRSSAKVLEEDPSVGTQLDSNTKYQIAKEDGSIIVFSEQLRNNMEELEEYVSRAEKMREKIFSTPVRVEHAYIEGGAYVPEVGGVISANSDGTTVEEETKSNNTAKSDIITDREKEIENMKKAIADIAAKC